MREDALEEANRRIEKLARLDLTPTRTLGLYVVGRLADRHGIKVRLLEGSLRGTVAKVFVPKALLADISESGNDAAAVTANRPPRVAAKTAPDAGGTPSEQRHQEGPVSGGRSTEPAGDEADRSQRWSPR